MVKIIRKAGLGDLQAVEEFLIEANIGLDGLDEVIENFLIIEENEEMCGTLGIEIKGDKGLFRSLVVKPELTSDDLFTLFREALKIGKEKQLTNLYLVSNKNSSIQFFHLLGFKEIEHNQSLNELFQFQHAQKLSTVDNCTFMKLTL
ncbi:GNAT family N-acetyltransferase [Rossellomorea sp. BNER]|uniref:GNAT family N-acetyltransferase n=1 Tax=Rossellomorea sp. BNER TaxID=2962031 RepID=UPI003AF26F25|nr:hypothetical protein [Rossellomorea sp. BNER]